MNEKVTVPYIKSQKGICKIKMITAFDTPSAHIADQAGADIILVGDSLATAVLGYETTLPVTIETMIHHTSAVARAKPRCLIVADMPWLSFHVSVEETVRNAARLIREGQAQAVKLEGGRKRLNMVRALLDAEIPVMGHIGLTPQSFNTTGGYHVQGKTLQIARDLIQDARELSETGIFSLVLEGIPGELAAIITSSIPVPTIGIGAGKDCDGQVLVYNDVLGLNFGHIPKFVRSYADLSSISVKALSKFFEDIETGSFPSETESYHLDEKILKDLKSRTK